MGVLVDTTVWSLLLRRRASARRSAQEEAALEALRPLLPSGDALLIGPVRQEMLTGIRDRAQFRRLRDGLRGFAVEVVMQADFERAAEFANTCRAAGVQGSPVDFLLCAVADRGGHRILTVDEDFDRFQSHIPVPRYALR